MDLSNLKPANGSTKSEKRIARGQGSGRGGTSTKGHKGAQSRSGYSSKPGFEGGQMPLVRRLPKYGFKNRFRVEYAGINLDVIQSLIESKGINVITPEVLKENGLISGNDLVKILGRGAINAAVEVTAHKFSASAASAIESKGGKINTL
jgi:large subunit ribosomal protein L15